MSILLLFGGANTTNIATALTAGATTSASARVSISGASTLQSGATVTASAEVVIPAVYAATTFSTGAITSIANVAHEEATDAGTTFRPGTTIIADAVLVFPISSTFTTGAQVNVDSVIDIYGGASFTTGATTTSSTGIVEQQGQVTLTSGVTTSVSSVVEHIIDASFVTGASVASPVTVVEVKSSVGFISGAALSVSSIHAEIKASTSFSTGVQTTSAAEVTFFGRTTLVTGAETNIDSTKINLQLHGGGTTDAEAGGIRSQEADVPLSGGGETTAVGAGKFKTAITTSAGGSSSATGGVGAKSLVITRKGGGVSELVPGVSDRTLLFTRKGGGSTRGTIGGKFITSVSARSGGGSSDVIGSGKWFIASKLSGGGSNIAVGGATRNAFISRRGGGKLILIGSGSHRLQNELRVLGGGETQSVGGGALTTERIVIGGGRARRLRGSGRFITITPPGTSWFVLTLDTTPPVIAFGTPTGAASGQTLRVPFTADNDMTSVSASLIDPRGVHHPVNVVEDDLTLETEFTIEIPEGYFGGNSILRVTATDDVGNTGQTDLTIKITGVPHDESILTGGAIGIYGPFIRRFEQTIPASVTLTKRVEFLLPAGTGLRKANQPVEFSLSGQVDLSREVSFVHANGVLKPSAHMSRIRNEDEEILLLIS